MDTALIVELFGFLGLQESDNLREVQLKFMQALKAEKRLRKEKKFNLHDPTNVTNRIREVLEEMEPLSDLREERRRRRILRIWYALATQLTGNSDPLMRRLYESHARMYRRKLSQFPQDA
jgi:hypothetical protein